MRGITPLTLALIVMALIAAIVLGMLMTVTVGRF